MRAPSRRTALLAGLALILLTNAFALGGVWWNRSGEPDSVLALSERELRVVAGSRSENSGLALGLEWRAVPFDEPDAAFGAWMWADRANSPAWLDRDKMQALGFRPAPAADQPRRSAERSREVLIVLELDGPVYHAHRERMQARAEREIALPGLDPQNREFAQRAERAREYLDGEAHRSRLFAVDAGLDLAELRAAYPDRSRHAIVRGELTPVQYPPSAKGPHGYIRLLRVGEVHVPFAHRALFESVPAGPRPIGGGADPDGPAFVAELAFGKRLEPWLRRIEPAGPPPDRSPTP